MELRDYVGLLRRRWLLVLLAVEAAVAAALVMTVLSPPAYRSTATLFVANPAPREELQASLYEDGKFAQSRISSYAELATGPRVTSRVVEQLQLTEDVDDLREKVSARAVPETVLIVLTVTDEDAVQAQRLTEAFADALVALVPELENPSDRDAVPMQVFVAEAAGPSEPVGPEPLRNAALGLVLGALTGVGLALLRETLDETVQTPQQLRRLTGTTPLTPGAPGRAAPRARRDGASDRLGWLASRIMLGGDHPPPRSLLLAATDDSGNEGVDPVDLGLALSHTGVDVVLLLLNGADNGLPGPWQQGPGLVDVLDGMPVRDALHAHSPMLRVLGAGRRADRRVQGGLGLRALLTELQDECELVLVAAPPLLTTAETTLLAGHAEAALLLVRGGSTMRDQVEHAVEVLEHARCRLVGTVLLPVGARPGAAGTATTRPHVLVPSARTPPDASGATRPAGRSASSVQSEGTE